jgi:hypothetical protein
MKMLIASAILLAGCASHGVTQDVVVNPDGTTTVFNIAHRTDSFGIDQSAVEVKDCEDLVLSENGHS